MPKKKKLTETEVHALIVRDTKYRLRCSDFEPEFTLHRVEDANPRKYGYANWDVESIRSAETWKRDCAQAFREAVLRTRAKFDIEWL